LERAANVHRDALDWTWERRTCATAHARHENQITTRIRQIRGILSLGTCGANEPKNIGPKKNKKMVYDGWCWMGQLLVKFSVSHYWPTIPNFETAVDPFGLQLRGNWPQFSDDFGWLSAKVLGLLKLGAGRAEVSQATATSWSDGLESNQRLGIYWELSDWLFRHCIYWLVVICSYMLLYVVICCYMLLLLLLVGLVLPEKYGRMKDARIPSKSNDHESLVGIFASWLHCPWKKCPTMEMDPARNTQKSQKFIISWVKFNENQYISFLIKVIKKHPKQHTNHLNISDCLVLSH
jgi:hypothetical protein